jgi:hypothetical protein
MQCYFDGSRVGLAKDESWLTLAGFVATDAFWNHFDTAWETEVLQKREPHAAYLHMADLLTGNGIFKGWDWERRYSLVWDAVNYLQSLPKGAFCAVYASIDESARNDLVTEGYDVSEPHVICAECTIGQAFSWFFDTRPDNVELASIYFDQNERFIHSFRQRWQRELKGQRLVVANCFWGLIADVEERDMRCTPGLQAADLLAWAVSRRHAGEERSTLHLANILEQIIPNWRLVLDRTTLREKHCLRRSEVGN